LPQGRYFLQPFILNPYVKSLRVPLFYFDVKAGETTYLGEIFMTRSCSMSNQFQVRDEFKRDWQMAIEKNPPLARRDAVKRLTSVGAVVTP